ncbi:MAG: methylated-DNA-[protein]-cysteine S-methyltransferase [Miltoncostaeaceae bacterium]|nr:methylated-DNA-[protein]-cysteine S-methyltransferase [Miltoncostaeaceae bacterium]
MTVVRYALVARAHGPWWTAWTDAGVCASSWGSWEEERFRGFLDAHHDGPVRRGDPAEAPEGIDWRFVRPGFRRDVLQACAEIPAGEVRTYGELAADAGYPGAARAVGTVMANNPLADLVPCHRVVRSDGTIGAYGAGGPARKAAMLAAEGVELAGMLAAPVP